MKFFIALVVLSFAMFSNAAEMVSPTPQTGQMKAKAKPPERQNPSEPPSNTTWPTYDSDALPEKSERERRIKKLERQMLATVGWTTNREGWPVRWVREDKLYSLHKKLTDNDWNLLAEMYLSSSDGRKDYNIKDSLRLDDAMGVLLGMHGQSSIDTLNKIIDMPDKSDKNKEILRYSVNRVLEGIEFTSWFDLSEYRKDMEKACGYDKMSACAALGRIYEKEGGGKNPSYLKAKEFYEKACNAGEIFACAGLGRLYDAGNGVKQDFLKAKELYEKACSANERIACERLGVLYEKGNGVESNRLTAKEYYEKSCNLYYSYGCGHCKEMKRIEEEESACASNEMAACVNLGGKYENGENFKQDFSKAKELYEKACGADEMLGCASLGRLYEGGNGVERDSLKAEALYEKACRTNMEACLSIGELFWYGAAGVQRDTLMAKTFYEKTCEANYAKGCFALGRSYEYGDGARMKPDKQTAKQFYKKACDIEGDKKGAGCFSYRQLNGQGRK